MHDETEAIVRLFACRPTLLAAVGDSVHTTAESLRRGNAPTDVVDGALARIATDYAVANEERVEIDIGAAVAARLCVDSVYVYDHFYGTEREAEFTKGALAIAVRLDPEVANLDQAIAIAAKSADPVDRAILGADAVSVERDARTGKARVRVSNRRDRYSGRVIRKAMDRNRDPEGAPTESDVLIPEDRLETTRIDEASKARLRRKLLERMRRPN